MGLTEASVDGRKRPESQHQPSHPADTHFLTLQMKSIAQHTQKEYAEINGSGGIARKYSSESLQRLFSFALVYHLVKK